MYPNYVPSKEGERIPSRRGREMPVNVERPKIQVDPRVVELRRRREEHERGRRESVRLAKEKGEKEALDIEKVVREFFSRMDDEESIKKTSANPDTIRDFEERYYLDAPANVKTTDDFIDWIAERERAAGSL